LGIGCSAWARTTSSCQNPIHRMAAWSQVLAKPCVDKLHSTLCSSDRRIVPLLQRIGRASPQSSGALPTLLTSP
jgi:hypothetical protein